MRKFVPATLVLCVSLLALYGCGGKGMGGAIKGKDIVTEGWIDDDTFQVIAWGEASPDATGEARWRNQAKEGAQMMAEKRIVEKFQGYTLEANGYTEEGANVMVVVTKDVLGAVKGGEVVKTTFDADNKAAEIVYRVTAKNLKKKVANFEVKPAEAAAEEGE
ncbi:MAG: hypothetical protein JXJ19_00220 [Elusimicrobia bacterium]|nr:hypothetical protein [Elusimicrobiota bacterium]